MHFLSSSERALRVFYCTHQFLREHDIHWLPVNPEDIIDRHRNWTLKYVHQVAYEIGKDELPNDSCVASMFMTKNHNRH